MVENPGCASEPSFGWTTHDVLGFFGARTQGKVNVTIDGISFDPSNCQGALFYANTGRLRTVEAAVTALQNGAVFVLSRLPPEAEDRLPPSRWYRLRRNRSAIHKIAIANRSRFGGKLIAITGSVGKTVLSHMVAQMLSEFGAVFGTTDTSGHQLASNLRTAERIAQMPPFVDYAVYEIAHGPRGLDNRAKIAQPNIGVITNIDLSHWERHGSRLDIQNKKLRIFGGIRPGGAAILCADTINFNVETKEYLNSMQFARIIKVGEAEDADVRVLSVLSDGVCISAIVDVFGRKVDLRIPRPAVHYARSAAFSLAIADCLRLDIDAAVGPIERYRSPKRRQQRLKVVMSDGRTFELIDDAYNAVPSSVRSLLDTVAQRKVPGRKIMIWGDILELGEIEGTAHGYLVPFIESFGADELITVGPATRAAGHFVEGTSVRSFDQAEEVTTYIESVVRHGDLVLMKASNGIRLKEVVDSLRERHNVSDAGAWRVEEAI